MDKKISVIVPVYKVEKWLDECVESIVNQSYKNLEIILVDDGSPDNCPQMCNEWTKRDDRIRVIHKENGGLSSARNVALDIITGDYISFIDSDDYIHRDMYRIMLEDMETSEADIVKCNRYIDNGKEIKEVNIIKDKKEYDKEQMLDCFFYHRDDFCSGIWDKLFRAELFKDIRFPDGINSEDYYVYASLYGEANKLFYNNIPLYYYRIREDSISWNTEINEHSFDKIIISDKVYEYVKKKYPSKSDDAQIFQAIARFAIYQKTMKQRHPHEIENEWIKSLKEKRKIVLKNKKIGLIFKIKYSIMCFNPKFYMFIKRDKVGK